MEVKMCDECYICSVSPLHKILVKAIKEEKWVGKHPEIPKEYLSKYKTKKLRRANEKET